MCRAISVTTSDSFNDHVAKEHKNTRVNSSEYTSIIVFAWI
jgi:hypothetical protein